MASAPRDRVILGKINFRDTETVVSCYYVPEHGGFLLLPISQSGMNYSPVFPTGWTDLPKLTRNIRET